MKKLILSALLIAFGTCFAQTVSIEKYRLKNGLEVVYIQTGRLPVTALSLYVNCGRKNEAPGQQNLASLTASGLLLGNSSYSRIDQDNLLSEMGTSITSTANDNYTLVRGQFLNRDISAGMQLFSAVALQPVFPQTELKEEIRQTLDFNNTGKMDITALAGVYSDYFVFGPGNPLGRFFYPAQLNKVGQAEVKEFHAFHYTPKNCRLVIAGNPDREAVKALVEKHFGTWTAGLGEANGASYEAPVMKKKEFAFVHKPGATQAALRWTKNAPAHNSRDLLPFELANSAFGKILFDEIRVKEGKTYGINSFFPFQENTDIYYISTQVRSEVMHATTESFDRVLAEFHEKGITGEQLQMAKVRFKSQYTSLETPLDMSSFFNPLLYPDPNKRLEYLKELDKITLDMVNKAIRKHFAPGSYKAVIAGDENVLKEQLEKITPLTRLGTKDLEAAGISAQEEKE
jgi:zinc protease